MMKSGLGAPPLIHIGYHKTGTTWLQSGLFAERSAGFCRPWVSREIRELLVFPDGYTYEAARAREGFRVGIEAAEMSQLVPVLSDERLSGSPHAGGYDSALLCDRLAEVFPEARVLIVIREQESAILSVYRQYVRNGGAAPLSKYLRPRNPAEIPQFRFSHYEYHHLVGRYLKRFGKEQVCILPFEQLRKAPAAFLARISAFAGLPEPTGIPSGNVYEGMGPVTVVLKRWFNTVFVRNSLNPAARFYVKDHEQKFSRLDRAFPRGMGDGIVRRWRSEVAKLVGDRYAMSNQMTGEMIGCDLTDYGYRLPEIDLGRDPG